MSTVHPYTESDCRRQAELEWEMLVATTNVSHYVREVRFRLPHFEGFHSETVRHAAYNRLDKYGEQVRHWRTRQLTAQHELAKLKDKEDAAKAMELARQTVSTWAERYGSRAMWEGDGGQARMDLMEPGRPSAVAPSASDPRSLERATQPDTEDLVAALLSRNEEQAVWPGMSGRDVEAASNDGEEQEDSEFDYAAVDLDSEDDVQDDAEEGADDDDDIGDDEPERDRLWSVSSKLRAEVAAFTASHPMHRLDELDALLAQLGAEDTSTAVSDLPVCLDPSSLSGGPVLDPENAASSCSTAPSSLSLSDDEMDAGTRIEEPPRIRRGPLPFHPKDVIDIE